MRAELLAFHHLPGRHEGSHLASVALKLLRRAGVVKNVGWWTADNASNNDTFMVSLAEELNELGIPFDSIENRIRCFPHIVKIASQHLLLKLSAMTDDTEDADFKPRGVVDDDEQTYQEALARDPIRLV